jgi:hypothetical protein
MVHVLIFLIRCFQNKKCVSGGCLLHSCGQATIAGSHIGCYVSFYGIAPSIHMCGFKSQVIGSHLK